MKSFTLFSAAALAFGAAHACEVETNTEVTFYGWPDNDPASAQVAHDCGGRNGIAGGTGTYADPLTFATAPGEFSACEIAYLPLLKKYIRNEDDCAQCTSDFKSGKKHIDIWTGSNKQSGGQKQIDCENELTSGGTYDVLRAPPQGLEVDTTPLFDNGKCNTGAVFESNKGSCSGGSGASANNATGGGASQSGSDGGNGSPSSTFSAEATATTTKKHKHKHSQTPAPQDNY